MRGADDAARPALPLAPDSYRHGLRPERIRSSTLRLRRHRSALRELRQASGRAAPERTRTPPVEPLRFTSVGTPCPAAVTPINSLETDSDELLHVEDGLIVTYRVLTQGSISADDPSTFKPSASSDALRYRSYLLEREARMLGSAGAESANDLRGKALASGGEFVLVLVPDAFMTLDTLEERFRPLLVRFPRARLLLLGLAGLPNTMWPAGMRLNDELHGRCIAALLQRLLLAAGPPVLLMGFGLGAHHLANYCATRLASERFYACVRAVVLVNGFVRVGASMRRVVSELSDALDSLGSQELNELIAALHLWDGHTELTGREAAMQAFWRSRRGVVAVEGGERYAGVQAQLRGLLDSPSAVTETSLLETCTRPLILVHSTEDVFVDPREAEKLRAANKALLNRSEVEDVGAMQEGALHVSWLKAGHEAIQERAPFFLALISRLAESLCAAQAIADRPGFAKGEVELVKDAKTTSKEPEDSMPEDEDLSEAEDSIAEVPDQSSTAEVEAEEITPPPAASPRPLPTTEPADAEWRVRRKQERVERLRKAEFEASVRFARDMVRVEELAAQERRETARMEREDALSVRAEAYLRDCEMAQRSSVLAKEKTTELHRLRRAEAIRMVEEQLARERAERIEQRRRKAAELLSEIESESMELTGERSGGYAIGGGEDSRSVVAFIEGTRRVLGDFMECRQRALQSLRRRLLVEDKMAAFKEHSAMLLDEVRKLRRALRMAESHPALVAGEHPIETQLAKMRSALVGKEQSYVEFTGITKAREKQLDAAGRNYQRMKLKLKRLEDLMNQRLADMRAADAKLVKKIGLLRSDKEELVARKAEVEYKLKTLSQRKEALRKERERVDKHVGHFCDTDLWIEGVLQRCVTKELRRHLRREYEAAEETLPKIEAELRELHGSLLELNEKLNVGDR